MMRNIGEIVGHPSDNRTYLKSPTIVSECLVGIEVEAEGLYIDVPRWDQFLLINIGAWYMMGVCVMEDVNLFYRIH